MATLAGALTLMDHAKRMDPDGKIARIAELVSAKNEVMETLPFIEGNLPTGHRSTTRTGLPGVTWRQLNYGVQPTKSQTKQVDDTVGMLEAFGEVDKDLAELNGNTNEFRMSEDKAKLEAMSQEFASTFFYGNTNTDPERFMGLAPRFSLTTAGNGGQIIKGSSNDTDNTSIWLVAMGPDTVHGIFPKGSKAGLNSTDLGLRVLEDAAGGKYMGYQSHYQMKAGLVVKDWRYVCRICNIEVSDLLANPTSGDNLISLMIQSMHKLHDLSTGTLSFFCNRTIMSYLDQQTMNQAQMNVTYSQDPHGRRITNFRGIPIRMCDALLNNEAAVS